MALLFFSLDMILAKATRELIIDADVHVLPADAAAVALASAVAGDAVADLIELAELFRCRGGRSVRRGVCVL